MCGQINVHGNYYYMVEGTPHMWAINMHLLLYGGGEPWCVAHMRVINVHSNYYYMVEGRPHVWAINVHLLLYGVGEPSHVGKLMCMVITTIWWRGTPHVWAINMHLLLYGGGESSCVAINMHGNCYYMVEGSPHMSLMCGQLNMHGNDYY